MRRTGFARRLRLTAGSLAVALVAGIGPLAGSASAAVPGLVQVSASTPSDSNTQKSVYAYCPAGTKLVGAGAQIVGGLGEVLLSGVVPISTLTGSQAIAVEDKDGFAGNWSVTAHAICAAPLPGLQLVIASSWPPSSVNPHNVSVSCPVGKQVLGTGFVFGGDGGREVGVTAVNPNPALTTVSVSAYELGAFGTLATWWLNGYAVCADPVPGLQRVSVTSALNSLSTKSITATCPAPKKATGVGALLEALATRGAIEDLKPNNSPPTAATATGYEHGPNAADWTVTSVAICADP